jgi:hypothetical protein
MDETLKQNLASSTTWYRGLYMVLFAIFYNIAEIVIGAVVIFQFLFTLFTGRVNQRLLEFGQSLSMYVYQVMRYLTYNSHEKPFPFSDWPTTEDESGAESEDDNEARF